MADDSNIPTGGVPPKPGDDSKVKPKKETVRISLPPKPKETVRIGLPAKKPGAPAAPVAAGGGLPPKPASKPGSTVKIGLPPKPAGPAGVAAGGKPPTPGSTVKISMPPPPVGGAKQAVAAVGPAKPAGPKAPGIAGQKPAGQKPAGPAKPGVAAKGKGGKKAARPAAGVAGVSLVDKILAILVLLVSIGVLVRVLMLAEIIPAAS